MSAPMPTVDANLALAKAMGSKRGYDPMPPDQHEWQRAEGQPPLYRLWSWMCGHTVRLGARSEFAVRNGKALTLKHAAAALGLDLTFVSQLWKQGEEMGVWHRDGESRKLYLDGEVKAEQIKEANERRKVKCTLRLSPDKLKKINSWPKARQEEFYSFWNPAGVLRKQLEAAAISLAREQADAVDDSIARRFDLEPNRNDRDPREPLEIPQMLFQFVHNTAAEGIVLNIQVKSTDGEETGEKGTVPSPHIRNTEKDFREDLRSVGRSATETPPLASTNRPTDPELRDLLKTAWPHIDQIATQALLVEIRVALGETPLERLHAAMVTPKSRTKANSYAFAVHLAREQRQKWVEARPDREERLLADAAAAAENLEVNAKTARSILNDPDLDKFWKDTDREWAREILAEHEKAKGTSHG